MTLNVDLGALDPKDRYKLLTAVVIPRPIAWVTTISDGGIVNAAPFSFFNLFGKDPALVALGLEHHADGTPKDTTRNIRAGGEFVINIATPDLTAAMVGTAAQYAPTAGEPEALGLPTASSTHIAPPRLADVPIAIECRRTVALTFSPEREIVIGEAVGLAARDGLVDPANWHVHWNGDYPVARLFSDRYARLEDIAPQSIPPAST